MKIFLNVLLFILISPMLYAQSENTSFLSKLYFPFDFGSCISTEKYIKSGSLVKTGLEYRIKKDKGLFVRFNFDNRTNRFVIPENQSTNVVQGKIKFDDYVIGPGYRIGTRKIKIFGLSQVGVSGFEFPQVTGSKNNYILSENSKLSSLIKLTLGLEYYVAHNAALTFESGYILHGDDSVFWNRQFSVFGFSIGLTTTLF